jgi:hypothetical protein
MLLNVPFSDLFFIFLQVFTPPKKKLVMTCKFECFQSHCHILNEFYEFLCMMDASIIFGEGSFRYIYFWVSYG